MSYLHWPLIHTPGDHHGLRWRWPHLRVCHGGSQIFRDVVNTSIYPRAPESANTQPRRSRSFDCSTCCRGYYFTEDGGGPFRSYVDMAAWFDRRWFDVLAPCLMPRIPKFDTSHPLVLCHMDLHMRNLILDAKWKLWFVDWESAGGFHCSRSGSSSKVMDILHELYGCGLSAMQTGYLDKLR